MSKLNCRSCQKLMRVGEIYIDGLCIKCKNIEIYNSKQQYRLNKVLSKFTDIISPYNSGRKYIKNGLVIFYQGINFSIASRKNILSLDTVEHLIKDMEVE